MLGYYTGKNTALKYRERWLLRGRRQRQERVVRERDRGGGLCERDRGGGLYERDRGGGLYESDARVRDRCGGLYETGESC